MDSQKNTPLSQRLLSVCSYVPQNSVLADIGTDHARVPIYLILSEKISKAIASDIGSGPLSKAKENALFYGVLDKIDLRLGSGMKTLKDNDANCVIIAGMGGELMSNILYEYIPSGVEYLILQPMTDSHFVREALCKQGFSIKEENLIYENDKYYTIIFAVRGNMQLSLSDTYVSPFLKNHSLYESFLKYKISRMEKAAKMAEKAGATTQLVYEYNLYKSALEKYFSK